jgi:hypothetical protein
MFSPSVVRAALQARLCANARHLIHPNYRIPLPVSCSSTETEEPQSELPASDDCVQLIPAIVADRAPLALVQHFDATASQVIQVCQPQCGARLGITCAQSFIGMCIFLFSTATDLLYFIPSPSPSVPPLPFQRCILVANNSKRIKNCRNNYN